MPRLEKQHASHRLRRPNPVRLTISEPERTPEERIPRGAAGHPTLTPKTCLRLVSHADMNGPFREQSWLQTDLAILINTMDARPLHANVGHSIHRQGTVLMDGASPLVIHGPSHAKSDFDLGPVTLSGYYNYPYEKMALDAISTSNDTSVYAPKSNNHLIDGKNSYNCSLAPANKKCTNNAERASLRLKPGKVHKLRLINTSVEAMQIFSIDGHTLTVTTMDFVPVEPCEVEYVILGAGVRAEVLVKGTGDAKQSYYMRTRIQFPANKTPDLPKKKPIFKKSVPEPDPALVYNITFGANVGGNHQCLMNNVTFMADWSRPLYVEAADGHDEYPKDPQQYPGDRPRRHSPPSQVGFTTGPSINPKKVLESKIPDNAREVCRAWDEYRRLNGENALPFGSGLR
ncbi:Cupredoxin [Colletotrichum falcatum]|nr:Cupredoxin [Colletotrichum falcatum]